MTAATDPHQAKRGRKVSNAEFRRLWEDETLSERQIGTMLGITQTAVSQRAMSRGLPHRPRRGGKPVCDKEQLRKLWLAGVIAPDIAAALGCNPKTVRNTRKRLGLPERGPGRWGKSINIAEFNALQLRDAMAASARETANAMRDAEMLDGRQDRRWPASRAA